MAKGFHHNKSLGQHFLKSDATAAEIVSALAPLPEEIPILEIGPGHGILSKPLLKNGHPIFFSEIDPRIVEFLQADLKVPADRILSGDFVKLSLESVFHSPFAVIGNFPYQISSQILFKILESPVEVPVLVGMFQREMARRVTAAHGSKDYGILSVMVRNYYQTEYLFELPPDAFDPPPKVHSAVIRLRKKSQIPLIDYNDLKKIVKAAFNQRRKTLHNALSGIAGSREGLQELELANLRAEQVDETTFVQLANRILHP